MSNFDIRTLIFLCTVMCALMTVVLYAIKRSYPNTIHGTGTWAGALALLVMASLLYSMAKGKPSSLLYTTLPSIIINLGFYCLYVGSCRLYEHQPAHRSWLAWIALIISVNSWFAFVEPDFVMRLRFHSTLQFTLFGVHAWFLVRRPRLSFARLLGIAALIFMTAMQLIRFVSTFLGAGGTNVFDESMIQAFYTASYSPSALLFSISAVLMVGEQLNSEYRRQATHDPLTNAYTRRYFHEVCLREMDRALRTGQALSVVMLDVDYFKRINDSLGHQAGDKVLIRLVEITQKQRRKSDVFARFGGEEFVILLPGATLVAATEVAERLRLAFVASSAEPTFTASFGAACLSQCENADYEELLKLADDAMYQAKAQGRNQVVAAHVPKSAAIPANLSTQDAR